MPLLDPALKLASKLAELICCVGALDPFKMITQRVPLENVVKGGFETLIAEKDKHVKILIEVAA